MFWSVFKNAANTYTAAVTPAFLRTSVFPPGLELMDNDEPKKSIGLKIRLTEVVTGL